MPTLHATSALTPGAERILPSRTMATRRSGAPCGAQAAAPVTRAQSLPACPRKVRSTIQPDICCWSSTASASLTPSPVRAVGPSLRNAPFWSGSARVREPSSAGLPLFSSCLSVAPCTGWTVNCAVRPMTSAASRGSCRPGSSTKIRCCPDRYRLGSDTPSASTRWRSTSRARWVDSASASTTGESLVSRTIWVPPRRSRPRRADWVRAKKSEAAITPRATIARHMGARDMSSPRWAGRRSRRLRRARRRTVRRRYGLRCSIGTAGHAGDTHGRPGSLLRPRPPRPQGAHRQRGAGPRPRRQGPGSRGTGTARRRLGRERDAPRRRFAARRRSRTPARSLSRPCPPRTGGTPAPTWPTPAGGRSGPRAARRPRRRPGAWGVRGAAARLLPPVKSSYGISSWAR